MFDVEASGRMGGVVSPGRGSAATPRAGPGREPIPPTPRGPSRASDAEVPDPAEETLTLVEVDPAARCGAQVGRKLDEHLKACGSDPVPGQGGRCALVSHKETLLDAPGYAPANSKGQLMMAGFISRDQAEAFPDFSVLAGYGRGLGDWIRFAQLVRGGTVTRELGEDAEEFKGRVEDTVHRSKTPKTARREPKLDETERALLQWEPATDVEDWTRLISVEAQLQGVGQSLTRLWDRFSDRAADWERQLAGVVNDVGQGEPGVLAIDGTVHGVLEHYRRALDRVQDRADAAWERIRAYDTTGQTLRGDFTGLKTQLGDALSALTQLAGRQDKAEADTELVLGQAVDQIVALKMELTALQGSGIGGGVSHPTLRREAGATGGPGPADGMAALDILRQELENQIEGVVKLIGTQKVVVMEDGTEVRSAMDCILWCGSHLPPAAHRIGNGFYFHLFLDAMSILSRCDTPTRDSEDKRRSLAAKIRLTGPQQDVAASYALTLPGPLGAKGGGKNADRKINVMEDVSSWGITGEAGLRAKLLGKVTDLEAVITREIDVQLPKAEYSVAHTQAKEMWRQSKEFLTKLIDEVGNYYLVLITETTGLEWEPGENISSDVSRDCWKLIVAQTYTFCEELYDLRVGASGADSALDPAVVNGTFLWHSLQAMRLQKEIQQHNYREHSCVMPIYTRHLFRERAATHELRKLQKKHDETAAKLTKLSSDFEKYKRQKGGKKDE